MIDVNKVLLVGVLEKMPSLKYLRTNQAVCNFRVITKDKDEDGLLDICRAPAGALQISVGPQSGRTARKNERGYESAC